MKKKVNTILLVATLIVFALTIVSFSVPQEEWIVPAKYKTMKNATDGKDEDDIGKDLYTKHCKSCHGKEGYGDGTKANELETEMRDISTEEIQKQKDGELYYKSFIGRDEMPNFEKKIKDEEDRWMIINFMRTLAE